MHIATTLGLAAMIACVGACAQAGEDGTILHETFEGAIPDLHTYCLLYTSDAADEEVSDDIGSRRTSPT